jgi:hypothetical protein
VSMTGELDGDLSVTGKATDIQKINGLLKLPKAGTLHIKSLSDLLDRLPADTSSIKRDSLKIAIQALETYPYDFGELKLDYDSGGGVGSLILDGPNGHRNFDMYLHPWSQSDASSKVANNTNNQ